ncbi:FCD domain-containing protein [Sphingobium chlorophenolicum]|uniref:Transcriptional regulator, GntR family n=1 Tax=Sphingobium chlorophenolicum TaxID=46429 RepID=A0A081REH3_SPHCR|nr:FCD domain-containing protein [Sphingobium chlorophenolicum]KEQ53596.1 Transcriptional regulator, GntR family [Sphingobium chlorophenolicum]
MEVDETQARVAADRLTADIRSGLLAPGSKLKVTELKTRYGIGASPLREALLMVTSLGYVTGESHRGYRVAALSEDDLADITTARQIIETGMLRDSMTVRKDEWAVGVIAALERLRLAVSRSTLERIDNNDPVGLAHRQFHTALVAGCPSERLMTMQQLLFDQAGRYRDVMIRKVRSREDFIAIHEDLARIVLSDDIEEACEALRSHLHLTQRDVDIAMREEKGEKSRKREQAAPALNPI